MTFPFLFLLTTLSIYAISVSRALCSFFFLHFGHLAMICILYQQRSLMIVPDELRYAALVRMFAA